MEEDRNHSAQRGIGRMGCDAKPPSWHYDHQIRRRDDPTGRLYVGIAIKIRFGGRHYWSIQIRMHQKDLGSQIGTFGWQSRFYDHIIRDDRALKNIRQYIVNN